MPPQGEVARQWFIPGEGIDRGVISADIQRYLGNDATVRPGTGTGEYQGVNGYWIKAYRNLTSAMIADLRADSLRWRQEQRQTGSGPTSYVGSRTYDESNAAGIQRRSGDSPSLDAYGNPSRGPEGRPGDVRRAPGDQMQIDSVGGRQPQAQGYGPQGYYQPDGRGQFPQNPAPYPGQQTSRDGRPQQQRGPEYGQQEYINNPYPSPAATTVGINQGGARERDPFANQQSYTTAPPPQYDQYGRVIPGQGRPPGYQDQPMSDVYGQPDSYGRYPVNQPSYGQDRNAPNYQASQVPPAGFTRQGEFYVPNTSGFGSAGMPATSGPEQTYYQGQPQQTQQRGQQNTGYGYQPEPEYPPQRTQPSAHGRQQPPSGGDERRRRNR